MRKNSNSKGFTLIELLVVISIIGFLSSVVLASLKTARERAKDSKIAQDLRQFGIAQQLYFDDHQAYALGDGDTKVFAKVENGNNFSGKDLNIFSTKIAEAAYSDTKCNTFLAAANKLVDDKYLSAVPKHPNDNSTTICYKAASTTTGLNFTAYSSLVTTPNKNVGVILGEINTTNLGLIYNATGGQYPRSTINGIINDLALAGDAILATTGGSGGGVASTYTLTVTRTCFTGGAWFLTKDSAGGPTFTSPGTFTSGTGVTLNSYFGSGSGISIWTGCNSTTGDICNVQMNSDKTISVSNLSCLNLE